MTGPLTRRTLLTSTGACVAAILRAQSASEPVKDKITSVKAWPVSLRPGYRAKAPSFKSDFEIARWRWRGPFAQLTGAIIVEIKTRQGLAGYGMGGGGATGAIVVERHLRDFLIGSDPLNIELLNDQMYSSTSYYGRKGIRCAAWHGLIPE